MEIIRPVRFAEVITTGGKRIRTFSGVAKAGTESNLSFKVAGTIQQIPVQVGDQVNQGQLLAKMDPADYQLQVQEAEAALRQAQSQARNAESNYGRIQVLYENNNASQNDLETARTAFESATAQVESIQNRLQLAELRVSYTDLKAPSEGQIASIDADVNENVSVGRSIMTLVSGEKPEVEIAVPEVLISSVQQGSQCEIEFDALPNQRFRAIVSEVGIAPTRFATTFPVIARIDSSDSRIRPGMTADVLLTLVSQSSEQKTIIPAIAVGEDRNGTFVYVLEPSDSTYNLARRRDVIVGNLTSEGMEILSGLVEGELVATAGVHQLQDAQKVSLLKTEF